MISDFHRHWWWWSYFWLMKQCRSRIYCWSCGDSYCLHLQGCNDLQNVGNATISIQHHQPKKGVEISYKFVHNHEWNGKKITKPREVWVEEFSMDYCNNFNKNMFGIWGIVTCRQAQRNDYTKSTLKIFNITKWLVSVEILQVILMGNINHWPFPFKNRNYLLQRNCLIKNNTAKHRTVIYLFVYLLHISLEHSNVLTTKMIRQVMGQLVNGQWERRVRKCISVSRTNLNMPADLGVGGGG
jgi:hypothetical protein